MDKIELKLESYKEVVEYFTKEKITNRITYLFNFADLFIKEKKIQNKVLLNQSALIHAVMDYFTDIMRLKTFTKSERVNDFKVNSYTCYWLLKRRPLQIVDTDINDELVFVNEEFVWTILLSFLTAKFPESFPEDLESTSKKCFEGFQKTLYYFLRYRDFTAQSLEIILLSFCAGIASTGNIEFLPETTTKKEKELEK